ncbi:amidohydrolase family protein [Isoptericola sp. b490]|nr:amidohydrolase family protein [Isoptericola sp. b490]MDO8122584.1 amidohydrolase family protein [Isoptericola sp. b490]
MTRAVDQVPPFAAAKIRAIVERHAEAMQVAREGGVAVAAGTDFATVGPTTLAPLGRNGEELEHLVAAGYTPLEAIEAATANAPATLGAQAPRSGLLAAGYDADVIAVDGDPTADIALLADPVHVTHVWKAGRAVKAPQ